MIKLKKILLTGASGFLGSNFYFYYHKEFEIIACFHNYTIPSNEVQGLNIDLTQKGPLTHVINLVQPDYILHFAANSNPEYCETNPLESYKINVEATLILAQIAAVNKIKFLFTSTDLVFDGKDPYYYETDLLNPISIYGKHKAQAEKMIMIANPKSMICRLPLLYGLNHSGYKSPLENMINLLKSGIPQKLFVDEFRTPASARNICEGIKIAMDKEGIILNLGGNEKLSRYEMGQEVCRTLNLNGNLLIPVKQSEVATIAKRPKDVSLDNNLAKSFGWQPGLLIEELKRLFYFLIIFSILFPLSGNSQKSIYELPHTLLWKVEATRQHKPSYIYGTMHTENNKAFHLIDSALTAFNTCESFAMEVNADSINTAGLLSEMMMPGDTTISSLLSKSEFDTLNSKLIKATGYPLILFDKIKPIYVWLMLSEGKEKNQTGNFLDIFFYKLAKQQGKNIYGLEQVNDQMKLLKDIPINYQLEMLKQGTKDYNKNLAEIKENYSAYEKADFEELMKGNIEDSLFGKDFNEKFITDRNHNMANAITSLINKASVFVAVGAAHLPGTEGLIQLLRDKGFRVSPVFSSKKIAPEKVKKLLKP